MNISLLLLKMSTVSAFITTKRTNGLLRKFVKKLSFRYLERRADEHYQPFESRRHNRELIQIELKF